MNKETMNIHKALVELKTLDARIDKAMVGVSFIATKKHESENIRGVSVSEATEAMVSAYNSVNDLISRRTAIKRAVVLSNAKTEVTIAGQTYTVAEAIEMKNHGLDGKRKLLSIMRSQYEECSARAERENNQLETTRADTYIKETFAATDISKSGEAVQKARKEYIEKQTVELVNPLKLLDKITALDTEINDFMVEVDSALSVSNAKTEIEIEY